MRKLSTLQRFLLASGLTGALVLVAFLSQSGGGSPLAPPGVLADEVPKTPPVGDRTVPMFGATHSRNMVNLVEKNMPDKWQVENARKKHKAENIKWTAKLGSKSNGAPTIAGGKIFVGTNNNGLRNPRDAEKKGEKLIPVDKGVIMCFRESDGAFLWQAVHDKHPAGRVVDWPDEGICSSPYIEGNRIWYVSNRCELVCADVDGLYNGNQGMQDEKYKDKTDADFIWVLDMMEDLGVFPHNLAVCSPVIVGDTIFILTGNGHDESHENIPAPKAPSFLAVDKNTGKVKWESNLPGLGILHGQWSNPCYAEIKGVPQVIFAAGDGWLYALNPKDGKLIWKFDCNPKAAEYKLGGQGTRNYIIATPVVHDGLVYINNGQDPEHGEGIGHLWCIDPSKATATNIDLSPKKDNFDPKAAENKDSGLVWHVGGVDAMKNRLWRRSLSTVAVHDGLCYAANLSGFVACFDAKTGQKHWEYDGFAAIWGSPFYVDGKVYLGTEEGTVYIFQAGKQFKPPTKIEMDGPIVTTPVACNGVLYINTRSTLFAIKKP
jgi:outer membrane protein assembly factor BamB